MPKDTFEKCRYENPLQATTKENDCARTIEGRWQARNLKNPKGGKERENRRGEKMNKK